jgi:putative transcriptional regulator
VTDGFVAHVPDMVNVKAIRKSLGLTQPEFSKRFGFDIKVMQDWEQNRRKPERAARALLTVIAREPDAVSRALAECVGRIKSIFYTLSYAFIVYFR